MSLKVIYDRTKSPEKIYDGFAPAEIIFTFQSVTSLDLWKGASVDSRNKISPSEIDKYSDAIKLQKKIILEKPEPIVIISAKETPVYFLKEDGSKYIVCYTLDEISPARYQCHLVAVLRED